MDILLVKSLREFLPARFKSWVEDIEAIAAVEAALIFPVLLTLLMGTFDMGYGILAAQKTIRAAQVTADLVARHKQVNAADVNEAIDGGRMALAPFDASSFGVDIVSVRFDEDNNPVPIWCETRNMTSNADSLSNLQALGSPGEGVVVVTVRYQYEPTFAGFVVDTIQMEEVSFVRGRLSSTVTYEGGGSC